jgi:hypothetical protein
MTSYVPGATFGEASAHILPPGRARQEDLRGGGGGRRRRRRRKVHSGANAVRRKRRKVYSKLTQ